MEDLGRSWAWALFFGFFTLVIGVLVMVWPEETLKALAILLGLQLFVVGIYRFFKSFGAAEKHRIWSILLGVFAVIVGIIVLRNVTETVTVLAVILGIFWVIQGIIEFVVAVGDSSYPQRGWSIAMGVISVIAGIIVLAWPLESVTALTWLMGIWLVILGIVGIIFAFQIRSASKKPDVIVAS